MPNNNSNFYRSIPLPWAIGAAISLAFWLISVGGDIKALKDLPALIQTMQVSFDQVRKDLQENQLKQRETYGDVQRLKTDLIEVKTTLSSLIRETDQRFKELERRKK